jgi:hypothetical protein
MTYSDRPTPETLAEVAASSQNPPVIHLPAAEEEAI